MALRRPGADPLLQRVLKDTYRITQLVGTSSIGRVYRGEHLRLEKPVVVKVIADEIRGSEDFRVRLRREAILQAMVNHPCAVQTLDLDEAEDGTLFLVQEDAPGKSLARLLAEEERLPVARAVDIARQLLEILKVAHEAQVLHRDLRPEQILVESRGPQDVVRVLGFGVATLLGGDSDSRPRRFLGTPFYMSPEQASGEPIDSRSDLYAVGLILYEMITGKRPIQEEDLGAFYPRLLEEYPARLSEEYPQLRVPKEVEEFLFTALSKDPYNRYQSAAEMLEVLGGITSHRTRNFVLVAITALVLGGVGVLTLLGHSDYSAEYEEQARAAMGQASSNHPRYGAAMEVFQAAEQLRESGDYTLAHQKFQEAQSLFVACEHYQADDEHAARQAGEAALAERPEHPLTALGEEALAAGEQSRGQGDYADAYEHFQAAARYFGYDSDPEEEAQQAQRNAVPTHPQYALGAEKHSLARRTLAQRPLGADGIAQAQSLFTEAAAHYERAVAYDAAHEELANQARSGADPRNPRYAVLMTRYGEAVAARDQGDYPEAYRLFDEITEGFKAIAKAYDPGSEQQAQEARVAADDTSEEYRRGEEAFAAGLQAKAAGNYTQAYDHFGRAQQHFALASYDVSFKEAATAARDQASREHPKFAQGEREYQRGLELEQQRHYTDAMLAFNQAKLFFEGAVAYDSTPEETARVLREKAYQGIVSYATGELAWGKAQEARRAGRLEEAYELFREAADRFKLAAFDPDMRQLVADAKLGKDPSSLEYMEGMRQERKGESLFAAGDGPAAVQAFRRAQLSYTTAPFPSAPGTSTQPPPPPVRPPSDEEGESAQERRLRRSAERARDSALELKETCDGWSRNGTINRRTVPSYREGVGLCERAATALQAQQYKEAEELYRQAIDTLRRVTNKVR